jgi:hypothetical protein
LDASNRIIKGFSDAFEQPLNTDICVNDKGGRQFELLGIINPPLVSMDGTHPFRWDGTKVVIATDDEVKAELDSFAPKAQTPSIQEQLDAINLALATMVGA